MGWVLAEKWGMTISPSGSCEVRLVSWDVLLGVGISVYCRGVKFYARRNELSRRSYNLVADKCTRSYKLVGRVTIV